MHYAKKSLELNLKTFLKPSDVKTCLEKHWKISAGLSEFHLKVLSPSEYKLAAYLKML